MKAYDLNFSIDVVFKVNICSHGLPFHRISGFFVANRGSLPAGRQAGLDKSFCARRNEEITEAVVAVARFAEKHGAAVTFFVSFFCGRKERNENTMLRCCNKMYQVTQIPFNKNIIC